MERPTKRPPDASAVQRARLVVLGVEVCGHWILCAGQGAFRVSDAQVRGRHGDFVLFCLNCLGPEALMALSTVPLLCVCVVGVGVGWCWCGLVLVWVVVVVSCCIVVVVLLLLLCCVLLPKP